VQEPLDVSALSTRITKMNTFSLASLVETIFGCFVTHLKQTISERRGQQNYCRDEKNFLEKVENPNKVYHICFDTGT
jgi:hypothetical protein